MTGLPTFRRGELARIKARELGAVVILDVGGRIAIGTTDDPRRYASHYASTRAPCRIVSVGWTLDTRIARRVRAAAEMTLSGRQIGKAGLFDVPESLAVAAVKIAAQKAGLQLQSTEEVLAEMRAADERKTEIIVRTASIRP